MAVKKKILVALLLILFSGLVLFIYLGGDSHFNDETNLLLENEKKRSHTGLDSPPYQENRQKAPVEKTNPGDSADKSQKEGSRHMASEERSSSFKDAFMAKFPGKWEFTQTEDGEVFRITGDRLNLVQRNMTLDDFAMEIAAIRGLPVEATSFSAQMPDSTEKGMKVATLNQLFLEMPVFRGYIKIALSRKDDAVFMINLSLRPVRKGDSIEILLPLDLARSQVEQHFTEQQKKFKIRSTRGPLFYAESEPHEPVWIFNVMVTSPKLDAIEIAVGARSKSIRYESSTMVH